MYWLALSCAVCTRTEVHELLVANFQRKIDALIKFHL